MNPEENFLLHAKLCGYAYDPHVYIAEQPIGVKFNNIEYPITFLDVDDPASKDDFAYGSWEEVHQVASLVAHNADLHKEHRNILEPIFKALVNTRPDMLELFYKTQRLWDRGVEYD